MLLESIPKPQVFLQLGWSKPTYKYRLEANRIESSFVEKAADGLVDNMLNTSEQHPLQPRRPVAPRAAFAARAASRTLGCISRAVASRTREVMTPLSFSPDKTVSGVWCPFLGSSAQKIKTLTYWSK